MHNLSAEDRKRLRMFDILLEDIGQGVIICDKKGKVILYNSAYSRVDRLPVDQVLDRAIEKSYDLQKGESLLRQVMASKEPVLAHRQQYKTVYGTEVDVIKDTYPILDGDEVLGAYAVVRDYTDAKIAAEDIIREAFRDQSIRQLEEIFDVSAFENKKMTAAVNKLDKARGAAFNVGLFGEKGTEQWECAKYIIGDAIDDKKASISFDCAAVTPEMLERIMFGGEGGVGMLDGMTGGTLVLTNVEVLSWETQLKLKTYLGRSELRVITLFTKGFDVLIRDNLIDMGLLYALTETSVYIPTFEERKDDLSRMLEQMLNYYSGIYKKKFRISLGAYRLLVAYDWPGNYLEMKNMIRSSVIGLEGNLLDVDDLPRYVRGHSVNDTSNEAVLYHSSLNDALRYTEREMVMAALDRNDGNISKAAGDLGISRQNLQYRMKKLQI